MEESFLLSIKSKSNILDKCLKKYISFLQSIQNQKPYEECVAAHQEFLKELEEVELSTSKLKNVINANLIDLEDKKKHLDDKLNRINLLQEEMEVLEKEIEKAYIYKKNNEEYIQMLKNIDQYMKKQDIEAQINNISEELSRFEKEQSDMIRSLQIRENQFKDVLKAIDPLLKDVELEEAT